MEKRVPEKGPIATSPGIAKKTALIDKVFTDGTVKSGGIIITGKHVAKI
jgi:hypothetical protein